MFKVFYQYCGMWCADVMYKEELKLFRFTKPDYVRIRKIQKIR